MGNQINQLCGYSNNNVTLQPEKNLTSNENNEHFIITQNNKKSRNNKIQIPTSSSTTQEEMKKIAIKEIKYDNGDFYIGEVNYNNKKHGKGKLLFNNNAQTFYEGEWEDDLYSGNGTLIAKKFKYTGAFAKGKYEGYGKYINIENKSTYEGEWRKDKKEGKGREIYSDGSIYEGTFEKGRKNGKGKFFLSNGTSYEGMFKYDKMNGKGIIIWDKDKRCVGNWKGNVLCGYGKLYNKKDVYIGYFAKDRKNGLGINCYDNSKSMIIGYWVNDNIEGLAVFATNEQGNKYWNMQNKQITYIYSQEEFTSSIQNSEDFLRLKEFYMCLKEAGELKELINYPKVF